MTVAINLAYMVVLTVYSLIVTGLWVCALIGGARDREDGIMVQASMDDALRYFRKRANELAKETGKLREEGAELRAEVEGLKKDKRILAKQYIKVQNEYAWYRMLVREAEADEVRPSEVRASGESGAVRVNCERPSSCDISRQGLLGDLEVPTLGGAW